MPKLRSFLSVFLISATIMSLSGCGSNQILTLNVKKGDNYKYTITTSTITEMDSEGKKTTSSDTTSAGFLIETEKVDSEGIATMNYKYDFIKSEIESDGVKQIFDTKKPDKNDPVSVMYSTLMGKGFTVKMSKFGEINEVSGLDKLFNDLINDYPIEENQDEQTIKTQIRASFTNNVNEEIIRKSIEQATMFCPTTKVKVGDSWLSNYKLYLLGNVDVRTSLIFNKIEGDLAYLSIKADFENNAPTAYNQDGSQMIPSVKGLVDGTIKVNKNNGFISNGEIKVDMSGSIKFKYTTQDIDMPVTSTSKIVYSTEKQ